MSGERISNELTDSLAGVVDPTVDENGYLWFAGEWSDRSERQSVERTKCVFTVPEVRRNEVDGTVSIYGGAQDGLPSTSDMAHRLGLSPVSVDHRTHTLSVANLPEDHPADDSHITHLR